MLETTREELLFADEMKGLLVATFREREIKKGDSAQTKVCDYETRQHLKSPKFSLNFS